MSMTLLKYITSNHSFGHCVLSSGRECLVGVLSAQASLSDCTGISHSEKLSLTFTVAEVHLDAPLPAHNRAEVFLQKDIIKHG